MLSGIFINIILFLKEVFVKSIFELFFVVFLFFVTSFVFGKTGEEIYNTYCTTCHSPKMAVMFQAPPFKDVVKWGERKDLHWEVLLEKDSSLKNVSSKDKEKIIVDALLASAIAGTSKGMPPRGTCMDCSDEEIRNTIIFLIS